MDYQNYFVKGIVFIMGCAKFLQTFEFSVFYIFINLLDNLVTQYFASFRMSN